ncbi:MAG: hypothetical protein M0Q16_08350 [Candidatus Cloacimonetes bacterium]|nr:hypothetical protein [Candidatus Cloacimonadota bacterium]MCK9185367.1 hypothetical protein [Candidatus Cloacimonadota bacterium]MCK9584146.1 hypothetical protein [Candidatus Cloacimonadota bacterium]
MRLDRRRLILILLALFILSVTMVIAQKQEVKDDNIVADFQVTDVPADDGTGLMLSWKPLDRSKRIIEYRVYRGIKPDQLFFLESIEVNPKSGVASDRMFYYDNSPSEISDVAFSSRIKREKGQPDNGILYRQPPRDLKFTATLLEKFQMISLAKRSHFYHSSQEVLEDPEAEELSSYAGLKANQQTVMAVLKPGETYYYSVVAVDERQRLLPHAEVQSAVPMPNAPDPSPALYSVVMDDAKELRFEWEYPINKSNLDKYRIWQLSEMPAESWAELKANPEAVYTRAKLVAEGQVGSGSLPNYRKVEMKEDASGYQNAVFALQLIDYDGKTAFSPLSKPRFLSKDALPAQTKFWVEDKPNDKGDRLTVGWDNPILFVVKTTSMNKDNSRLRVNYQLNKTENQKVTEIWFTFTDPETGEQIAKLKEFYLDDSMMLNLPKGYDFKKGLKVQITMTGEPEIPNDYVIEQDLVYDPGMMALLPSKALYRNERDVSKIYNVVYRKYMQSPAWRLVMRNTSFDNSLDVTVPYGSQVQKWVQGISYAEGDSLIMHIVGQSGVERKARKLLPDERKAPVTLMSHKVDFTWDAKNEELVSTSIFEQRALEMHEKTIVEAKAKIAELTGMKAGADQAEILEIDAQIARQQAILDAHTQNEVVQHALSAKSNRHRVNLVLTAYDDFTRSQTFKVVRTDSKGLFIESALDLKDDQLVYHKPISNWFDNNKYVTLFTTLLFFLVVVSFVTLSKRGKTFYIRPIAGLQEIDNAIGRATEMGRPMLYCMGHGSISDVATIASMGILSLVAKRAAEYDTKLIVPCYDYIIMPIAQEIVREAHYAVGRPDTYDRNNVFYLTNVQFAYVAGVNGIMVRERMATNFFLGYFSAEALLMTETGNSVGAVQIAGTDAVTQIPFFITTCDYTLIGEELYAASAYLNHEPMLLGTLKAQDYFKLFILTVVIIGAVLSSFEITGLTTLLPEK